MSSVRKRLLIVALTLLIAGCAAVSPDRAQSGATIRVLLLKGAPSVSLKGVRDSGEVQVVKSYNAKASVNGLLRQLPVRFYPGDSHISVNGRQYAGVIEVMDAKSGLLVVNELPLEVYISGIINNEISTKWPADVVKAQAVIARTYALYQRDKREGEPYHIEGSVLGQVYSGIAAEDEAALKAVKDTRGEVLYYNGGPALTVYHSNAGGKTDSSKDIWKVDYPYLTSVESPYDNDAPQFEWEYSIPALTLKEALRTSGYSIGEPESITVEALTPAGRVRALSIKDYEGRVLKISGENLRKAAGYSLLRSSIFSAEKRADTFVFRGKGSGHGVGLSQWGAKGMAENGYSYREIIRHYYPGTALRKAY